MRSYIKESQHYKGLDVNFNWLSPISSHLQWFGGGITLSCKLGLSHYPCVACFSSLSCNIFLFLCFHISHLHHEHSSSLTSTKDLAQVVKVMLKNDIPKWKTRSDMHVVTRHCLLKPRLSTHTLHVVFLKYGGLQSTHLYLKKLSGGEYCWHGFENIIFLNNN